MENLDLYNRVRQVPEAAKKPISGGRMNGKTDINPMWRIKTLTEQFGPCGFGWYYDITNKWLEHGANDETSAFVDINLYIKIGGEWSKPIAGTGGSAFVAKERSGLYTSDECYKMALTDALSVSCKALGIGADVYWDKDNTKYDDSLHPEPEPESIMCEYCNQPIKGKKFKSGKMLTAQDIADSSKEKYGARLCYACSKLALEAVKKDEAV
jgi:hypothetical protein